MWSALIDAYAHSRLDTASQRASKIVTLFDEQDCPQGGFYLLKECSLMNLSDLSLCLFEDSSQLNLLHLIRLSRFKSLKIDYGRRSLVLFSEVCR